jgi:hypothetical protein
MVGLPESAAAAVVTLKSNGATTEIITFRMCFAIMFSSQTG